MKCLDFFPSRRAKALGASAKNGLKMDWEIVVNILEKVYIIKNEVCRFFSLREERRAKAPWLQTMFTSVLKAVLVESYRQY